MKGQLKNKNSKLLVSGIEKNISELSDKNVKSIEARIRGLVDDAADLGRHLEKLERNKKEIEWNKQLALKTWYDIAQAASYIGKDADRFKSDVMREIQLHQLTK